MKPWEIAAATIGTLALAGGIVCAALALDKYYKKNRCSNKLCIPCEPGASLPV